LNSNPIPGIATGSAPGSATHRARAASPQAAIHLLIEGRVQGVGFRWTMCGEALRLGLRGWVRNRRDGAVEAVAIGPVPAVDDLRRWALRGPTSARVDRLRGRPANEAEIDLAGESFSERPTS
jgi:acylphosphatase